MVNNQHHAWKNITVIKTTRMAQFSLRVLNPTPALAEFRIAVNELDRQLAMGPVEQEQLLTASFVDLVQHTDKPKGGDNGNGDDGDGSKVRPGCLDEPRERTRLRQGGQLVLTGLEQPVPLRPAAQPAHAVEAIGEHARGREVTLAIEPGDRVPVVLSAEFGGDPGEVHTFDMTQTTSEGHVMGGMRLIVVNVPAWLGG